MADAGYVVAEVVVMTSMAVVAPSSSAEMIVVVMMVMVVVGVIPVGAVPSPVAAVPIVRTVPRTVPVAIIIRIAPSIVEVPIPSPVAVRAVVVGGVESPVPGIAYINIGVASAIAVAGVIVVIIVQAGRGFRAKSLDTGSEVGIVIRLRGGVHHAIGIRHRLRGLINRIGVRLEVLAVAVIRLIVVVRAGGDGTYAAAVPIHLVASLSSVG